ncbi:MAG: imidazolonepropionase [Candidatus Poseidoniaceae archaeon]|jgi:imidazolonepropionase|nr:imidazolonepropionase [Candidatus Poseidoniaceae archaeon]
MQRLLLNAGPIVHLAGNGPLIGSKMLDDEHVIDPGYGILIDNHIISKISPSGELSEEYNELESIDLEGRAIIPGLVDTHTHLLWAGDRSREVRWRQQGMSYKDIAEKGGGIASTVMTTRKTDNSKLMHLGVERLREALRNGTTHLEAKSGYGLDTKTELRLLEVASKLGHLEGLPSLDLTWLGAHAAPPGKNIETYTEEILSEQLPEIIEQGIARSADVFCEPGWFSVEQSEDILKASKSGGMDLRIHIDEFVDGGGGELAAELKVTTADHAHWTNNDARQAMSDAGVNAGFLPGTPYSMGEEFPPFQECIDNEWLWSYASDFNPNCQTLSLPFLASILVQRNDIDPLASLAACSRNSAETSPHPSGLVHGRIQEGSIANLNILESENWESWCLRPGINPFSATIIEGELIYH